MQISFLGAVHFRKMPGTSQLFGLSFERPYLKQGQKLVFMRIMVRLTDYSDNPQIMSIIRAQQCIVGRIINKRPINPQIIVIIRSLQWIMGGINV